MLRLFAQNVAVSIASLGIALTCGEFLLFLRGFPTEWYEPSANPPHFRERRENIEFSHEFETNSQGLRSPEIPLAKPNGTHRVFVVGDSFVEGGGVTSKDTFVSKLERTYRTRGVAIDFINGGLTGSAALQYARVFLDVGLRYQPDGLLICIYANDVSDTPPSVSAADLDWRTPTRSGAKALLHWAWPRVCALLLKARYGRAPSREVDLVAAVSRRARTLGVTEERIRSWEKRLPPDLVAAANAGRFNGYVLSHGLLRPDWWTTALDLDGANGAARFRAMASVLTELVRRSRAAGVSPAIVFIPVRLQYDALLYGSGRNLWSEVGVKVRPDWLDAETKVQRELRAWAAASGVPLLDLTPAFRKSVRSGPLTFAIDEHLVSAGHALVAESIVEWFEVERPFPFLPHGLETASRPSRPLSKSLRSQ